MKHFQCLRMSFFTRPVDKRTFNAVLSKGFMSTVGCKEFVSLVYQHTCCIHHISLLLHCTCRKQDVLFRNTVADRQHGFQYGTGSVTSDTADLTCRSHIHSQYRVSFLQTVERELRSLNSHIVQFKEILFRFLHRKTQHHFGCQLNEVYLQHFADKRERTAGTQITFDYLNIIIFCQVLDVERTGNIQCLGNLTADAFDATDSFHIQLLRRKLNSGITGVYTGKLNMFADCIGYDFTILRHSIHFHFLRMFDKLTYYHRMLL